ncbi:MAG: hypothetical protein EPN94_03445 [Nitrospirae bacterium]|nr:MAG: hypothetical protein EPN94_03445 [Nitrospirota bacterium]
MKIPFFRQIAWYLVAAMFVIGIVPRVEAGLSPSEVINADLDRTTDLANIQQVIETKMVRERLEKLGFTSDEIKSRLSRLSDQQVHKLALNLDEIKTGSDGGLDIIVALLAIMILIVFLMWLMDRKVVIQE